MAKDNVLIVGIRGCVGSACADVFGSNGYRVIGTTSNKSSVNDNLLWADFNDADSIDHFVLNEKVKHVIIASGLEPQLNLHETTRAHLNSMMNIHVTGPMLLLQKIYKQIEPGGCVVFLSSPAAIKGSYDPVYAAAKGATNTLIKTLAKDFAPGIRVNAVSPSLLKDSPVYERMTPDFREKHLNNTLTRQHTTAEECAEAIYFMCISKQVTGQVLQVNGGMV